MELSPGCPDSERLLALLRGALPEPEQAALSAHLEDCDACQKRLEAAAASAPFWSRVASHLAHAPADAVRTPTWPGYEILSELGRGGFGVVYKARQIALKRLVALKTINSVAADADDLARFRREAEAVARLQHPNVVQIFEVGEHGGRPFFSMVYIDGGSLADRLAGTPWPPRQGADLVQTLAGAVHAAHEKGVIHRDLKPANILLAPASGQEDASPRPEAGANWVPKVTDFGLAKQVGDAAGITQTGAIVGTPNYMAPEQASGRGSPVGRPADVYALGAVLYEVLTGRPPFQGVGVLETLDQVRNQEPVPPRALQPAVPRDLDAVCLKCLRKEPEGRYASALQLAEELGRFRRGEPLRHTRPVTTLEKAWRWSRRHPARAAAAGLGAVALVTLTVLVVVAVFAGSLHQEREKTQSALDQVTREQVQTDAARRDADRFRSRAEELSALLALERGLNLCNQGEVDQGLHWFVRGLKLTPPGSADLERVIRTNLASWPHELNSLQHTLPHPGERLAFSPDGKLLLTGGNGPAQIWNLKTGEPVGPPLEHTGSVAVAFSPDGKTILTADTATVQLWRTDSREAVGEPLRHEDEILTAVLTPDGRFVITGGGDKTVRVWEAATGKQVGKPLLATGLVTAVAVRHDGTLLAAACEDGTAWLWDLRTRKPIGSPLRHKGPVSTVTFSRDGHSLMTTSEDGHVRLFAAATGEPRGQPVFQGGQVMTAAFNPKTSEALTGSNQPSDGVGALAWRPRGDQSQRFFTYGRPLSHSEGVQTVAFGDNGDLALTAGVKVVRLWDASTWQPVGQPLVHSEEVVTAAFSPDGTRVATGGRDDSTWVWLVGSAQPSGRRTANPARLQKMVFSADGRTALMGDFSTKVHHLDLATGKPVHPAVTLPGEYFAALALSRDGTTAAARMRGKWTAVWNARTGEPLVPAWQEPDPGGESIAALSPDGKILTLGDEDVIAKDGDWVDQGTLLRLWNLSTPRPAEARHSVPGASLSSLLFSPDGRTLYASDLDRVLAWDAVAGRPLATSILPDMNRMGAVAWSPDGRALASVSSVNSVLLWDATTGRHRDKPLPPNCPLGSLAFSPDGGTLAFASPEYPPTGRVVLWDVAAGQPLGPPHQVRDSILTVGFAEDGRTLLVGGAEATRSWQIPVPLTGSVEEVALRMQVLTGKEMDDSGVIRLLDAKSWEERRRRLSVPPGAP